MLECKVRVLILDDHPIVRAGLTALLGKEKTLTVLGGFESWSEAAVCLRAQSVDVVLLDLRFPAESGLDILPRLKALEHPPQVLILSSFEYEEEIYRAARGGASGYMTKTSSGEQIVNAIMQVYCGRSHFPEAIAARLAERESRASLSMRELEVLQMLSKGLTNKEIAHLLQLSPFTVRNHIIHILEKLDVSSRTEAVALAMQQGVLAV